MKTQNTKHRIEKRKKKEIKNRKKKKIFFY
jgi:hypothetical protein